MRRYGIVSLNHYVNFTNYGSILQSYALQTAVDRLGKGSYEAVILDYCPKERLDYDPLNPFRHLWDRDEETRRMVELSMPAIRENYEKLERFVHTYYRLSGGKYTADNLNDSLEAERLDGYICGSDAIWCVREMKGFDDGFFANVDAMRNSHTITYAASFQNADYTAEELETLKERLKNFRAISVREDTYLDFIRAHTAAPVHVSLDPTLLLPAEHYEDLMTERLIQEPYLLLYSRRYDRDMQEHAERQAAERGLKLVEISIRATNAEKGHRMFYEAGVEEFLSLVRHAEYVVTNSFHGAIFSILFHREFAAYLRELCDTKVEYLLKSLELEDHLLAGRGGSGRPPEIDYRRVDELLRLRREQSSAYLRNVLVAR